MKSILFITGSYPPDICGVGDYLYKILTSNVALSNNWKLFYRRDWRLKCFFKYLNEIQSASDDIVCLQYPTQGYGWSIVPHLLCVYMSVFTKKEFAVCLHEFANSSFKSKFATFLFLLFSNKVIFTTEYERQYALAFLPYKRHKYEVVKICSNISRSYRVFDYQDRTIDLLYFGHIRPYKGIEEFLHIACDLKKMHPDLKVALMGQIPLGFSDYFSEIEEKCKKASIGMLLNKSELEVMDLLNKTKYALLPFPDGISERRGSFLACISNGVNVITRRGKYSTDVIDKVVYYYDGSCSAVERILNSTESVYLEKQKEGVSYIRESIPQSWEHVANNYIRVLI